MDRPDVSDNGETGIILWLDDPKRDKGKFGIKNSEFGISGIQNYFSLTYPKTYLQFIISLCVTFFKWYFY